MDSLSQIVLGAACGEIVLGKKLGNKAMLAGAIGGTIPDLDVLANPFLTEIQGLDFHRGITHSILFSVLAPFVVGAFYNWFYKKNFPEKKGYRIGVTVLAALLILFFGGFALTAAIQSGSSGGALASGIVALVFLIPFLIYVLREPKPIDDTNYWEWYKLFFWAFLTHVMLDAFTNYGTQIFMPFSNYRFALSTISVADPLYTTPFLLCLILAAFMRRRSKARRIIGWAGIIISTLYIGYTIWHKVEFEDVVRDSIARSEIQAQRFTTCPSILTNELWSATVESDTSYFVGAYSFHDPEPFIQNWIEIPKNRHLIPSKYDDGEVMTILTRFSNDYYFVEKDTLTGNYTYMDLRFGSLDNVAKVSSENRFPFTMTLSEENGALRMKENREPPSGLTSEVFQSYWDRIWGKWQR